LQASYSSGETIVAELIVVGFKDMTRADEVIPQLQEMQGEGLTQLADWARDSSPRWQD
jgi:uncharacterized membrane protein